MELKMNLGAQIFLEDFTVALSNLEKRSLQHTYLNSQH